MIKTSRHSERLYTWRRLHVFALPLQLCWLPRIFASSRQAQGARAVSTHPDQINDQMPWGD